ncbi:hypothetical protein ASD11_06000 [Aeromicrobium sp. Root495]|uniref:SipW-dependent-type signal peptide-containing protein n=1 Tax=Aeromicrobium sp. Root495 TaxID=1736550 RepID=UPI0006F438C5|nr:SipW-dependent-type signal peptide-containing protein [Aeromicrobium sp. Root495]KQY59142.1 hypothetical protein ASD11_06000 [Aeromicrobium sp. Root495]
MRQTSGSHTAPRRRAERRAASTSRSTRLKAALCLGVVVCLGSTGTWASWSDTGTITGATIKTGTLDLTAGPSTGAENLVGTGTVGATDAASNWDYTALAVSDLAPGESISKTVVVKNSGTAPFTFNGTVTTTTNDLYVAATPTQGLQVIVFDGATAATPTGTAANGDRVGGCTGGTSTYSQNPSTSSTTTLYGATPVKLVAGATRSLCVRVILSSTATNTLQNKSTKVVMKLDATQATS